ncbi:MAG: caspase family protein [Deltaproteobacteria bacterium]|nr:caspase family protein [Deltaproteobacteria bacterium]
MSPRVLLAVTVLLALGTLGSARPAAARAPTRAFALVIGNNRSLDPGTAALRYADDDAARFYELISSLRSARVHLLTVFDRETQATFPHLAGVPRPPTREALRQAMAGLVRAMEAARREGARTVFYFYYAGHGDVGGDREGYVHLLDGRFARSDLLTEVIARSSADLNHVIIDACNSYFLVNARRPEHDRRALRGFLTRASLERYPTTGVILSTATAAESHEWAKYRSGVFSHEVISALLGGADVDGDRRVDYQEVAAFVAAANLKVRDVRARLSVFARPPRADQRAVLMDLGELQRVGRADQRPARSRLGAYLTLPEELTGRYYLEDDRGVRYLDLHKSAEQPLRLALLDRPFYYLRSAGREALIRLDHPADVDARMLAFADIPVRSRGSVEESFRHDLYAVPFGRSFASGHGAAEREDPSAAEPAADVLELAVRPAPWYGRLATWKWTAAGAAAAAFGAGLTLELLASRNASRLDSSGQLTFPQARDLMRTASEQRTWGGIALGIAGTAALTSAVLFLLDRRRSAPNVPAGVTVGGSLAPEGGALSLSGNF